MTTAEQLAADYSTARWRWKFARWRLAKREREMAAVEQRIDDFQEQKLVMNETIEETMNRTGISKSEVTLLRARIQRQGFIVLLLGALASVASAQLKGSALMLPSKMVSTVRTNTSRTLVWDSGEPQFNVYRGAKRSSLVKVATVSTNGYPHTNGVVYAVSSVNFAGVESSLAYYPSNRVGALQWQTSTNLSTWTTGGTLETFTNTPVRPRMFLRIVDQTTGWLPPD